MTVNPNYEKWASDIASQITALADRVDSGTETNAQLMADCKNLYNNLAAGGEYNDLGSDDSNEDAILIQTIGDGDPSTTSTSDLDKLYNALAWDKPGSEIQDLSAQLHADAASILNNV